MEDSLPHHMAHSPSRQTIRGFTLLEVLVVSAIISVLCILIFGITKKVQRNAKQTLCIAHLRDIHVAILRYAADNHGNFPMTHDDNGGGTWTSALHFGGYVPSEPSTATNWSAWRFTANPSRFTLFCPGAIAYDGSPGNHVVDWGNYGMNRYMTGFSERVDQNPDGSPIYRESPQVKIGNVKMPSQKILVMDAGYYSIFASLQWQGGQTYTYIPGLAEANKSVNWRANAMPDPISGRHNGKVNILMVDGHVETWGPDDFSKNPNDTADNFRWDPYAPLD